MTRLILPALLTFVLADGQDLSTQYKADHAYRVEVTSSFSMETVDFSMERDGEPVEGGFGGGDRRTEQTRELVMIDTVLEAKDGQPQVIRRAFEKVSGSTAMTMGDNEMDSESECPLNEVVVELSLDDGEVSAKVLEGDEPDDETLLQGHSLTLALDALLPDDEVEAGDTWDLDGEALLHALGLDLEKAYFPPPTREEGEGRGEGRGGRRGGRGMRGGGGGAERYVTNADWDAEAELESDTEDRDGVTCHVISIKAEATGELPEQERGGRDRQDRSLSPMSPLPRPENSFEFEIEGKLYFSVEGGHPVHLELEGTLSTESLREMQRRDSFMVISSSQEGTFKYSVDVSPVALDGDGE